MLRARSLLSFGLLLSTFACGGGTPPAADAPQTPAPTDESPKWEGADTKKEPAPAKHTSGMVNEKAERKHDEYDKEATEVVLKRAARQVKDNCGNAKDENGKAPGPWGTVKVQVALGRNGHGKGVTMPAEWEKTPPGKCITQAFSNLTFPPWNGADTTVEWSVDVVKP